LFIKYLFRLGERVEDLSQGVVKLLLPFTVPSQDRKEPLRREMELATIFSLSELGRDKGGGLISKRPPEKITFISEACYPIWLAPWRGRTLLLDGFGLIKHTIQFDLLPDIEVFMKEIKGNSDNREAYIAFLRNNLNYFKNFSGKGEKTINGLITDPILTQDLAKYLEKAKHVRGPLTDRLILSPALNEDAVRSVIQELMSIDEMLRNDVKRLRKVMHLLMRVTQKHIRAIEIENEKIRRRFGIEIERFKARFKRSMDVLRRNYDRRIKRIRKETEQQIQRLQKEQSTLEARKDEIKTYTEKCKVKLSECEARRDVERLSYWRQEIDKSKKEMNEVERRITEIDKRIRELESSRDLQISQLRSDYNLRIGSLPSEVRKIETARDAKIKAGEEEAELLKNLTSNLISQINALIELRKPSSNDLLNLAIPTTRRKIALVHIPFFLVCYKRGLKRRYVLYPPSVANSMSATIKFKGAFKSFRVRMLLNEISRPITKLLNNIIHLIEQDPLFEEKIFNAGVKTNILRTRKSREVIGEGLLDLKMEGWLSDKEFQLINEQLA